MSTGERGVELRVGLLVAICTGLLVTFIVVLGGVSTVPVTTVFLDVDTSASLKPGAPIRVAGVDGGKVRAVDYRGGAVDPAVGRPVWVRVTLDVHAERAQTLNDRARFYITTQGVLGEKYVEIEPSAEAGAPLTDGVVVVGEPPLRLEVMAIRTARLIDAISGIILRNEAAIDGLVKDAAATMATVKGASEKLDRLLADGGPMVVEALGELDAIEAELLAALKGLNAAVGDGSELRGVVTRVSGLVDEVRGAVGPVVSDARGLMARYDKVGATADELMQAASADVRAVLSAGKGMLADAASLVAGLRRGEGTIGALLADREMYEDIREMMKDLKRHPWKFIWKE
jgi:phospholipid/cholesterol/gamma-HCH transport system substrate-binding protein